MLAAARHPANYPLKEAYDPDIRSQFPPIGSHLNEGEISVIKKQARHDTPGGTESEGRGARGAHVHEEVTAVAEE